VLHEYEEGDVSTYLLKDSGYPDKPHVASDYDYAEYAEFNADKKSACFVVLFENHILMLIETLKITLPSNSSSKYHICLAETDNLRCYGTGERMQLAKIQLSFSK
jgi:hypothetical protein